MSNNSSSRHVASTAADPSGAAMSRRPRRSVLMALLALIVAMLPQLGAGTPVFAAVFEPIDFTTEVNVTSIVEGSRTNIVTTAEGCIPAGQADGDTFELALPAVLADWPPSFRISDSTNTIFNVTIAGDPGVATFTLTAYGAGLNNGCFSAFFSANAANADTGTYPLDYTLNGTLLPNSPSLTVTPPGPITAPTRPNKVGFFNRAADQCRTNTQGCLTWGFETPAGNNGIVSFADLASPTWEFECDTIRAQLYTIADGVRTVADVAFADYVSGDTCSATDLQFDIDTTSLAANQYVRVRLLASAVTPVEDGGFAYENEAQVTVNGTPSVISSSRSSAFVGGIGQGDAILIEKRDSAGNDADTAAEAVTTDDGTVDLVFTIRNTGTNTLTDVAVTDLVTEGTATVSGLSCDFSELGGPTTGTTWDGPFESTDSFDCTATLSGVVGFSTDVATVTATGNGPVDDDNPFVAFRDLPGVAAVSVGDYVWFDSDADGLQDAEEDGIAGVTLTLTGPDGAPVTDIFGNPVAPTLTDADGLYSFDNLPVLPAGDSYTVTVTPPTGFVATLAEADPATGSSTGSATSGDLTNDEDRDPTLDFGFVVDEAAPPSDTPSVSVGDYVWFDSDADGLQDAEEDGIAGVTLTLTGPDGAPVTDISGNPVAPTLTDADGLYSFDNLPVLPAGDSYTVTVTPPTGFVATLAEADPATGSSTGSATSGDLTNDEDRDPTLDFGFIDPDTASPSTTPSVSVGDYVFIDTNGDGIQDASDVPVPGATLTLTGPDGQPVTDVSGGAVATTVTDADGRYSFDDLPALQPGESYTVTIDPSTAPLLVGLTPAPGSQGTAATDSSTGSASSTDLVDDGDRDDTLDFGFVRPDAELPATGSTIAPFLGTAFAALALGLTILLLSRRRRITPRW